LEFESVVNLSPPIATMGVMLQMKGTDLCVKSGTSLMRHAAFFQVEA
jgi:hypothetical protein